MKKRRFLAILMVLMLTLQLFIGAAPAVGAEGEEDVSSTFSDPAVLAAVKEALGIEEGGALSQAKLKKLTSLTLTDPAIVSLKGLEGATGLATLAINGCTALGDSSGGDNNVAVLSALPLRGKVVIKNTALATVPDFRSKSAITELDLSSNRIASTAGLDGTSSNYYLKLSTLNLSGNSLTAAPVIKAGTKFETLDLSHNNISTGLDNLAGLAKLRYLQLEYNSVGDDVFDSLPATLATLDVSCNNITGLDGLVDGGNAKFTQLTSLGVSGMPEQASAALDLSPLDNYHQLITLKVSDRALTDADVAVIGAMSALEILHTANCGLEDFGFMASGSAAAFPKLKELDVSDNDGGNSLAAALAKYSKISVLFMNNTGVDDLSCLSAADSFRVLEASSNGIQSISGLPAVSLRLVLSDNHISDITSLSGGMTTLDLSDNELISLAGVPAAVTTLYASNNRISDMASIADCTNLRTVLLDGNLLTDAAPLASLTKLRKVALDRNYIDVSGEDFTAQLAAIHENCDANGLVITYAEQLASEAQEGPIAPPSNIGSSRIVSAILLNTETATRGGLVSVRAVCKNEGPDALDDCSFEVVFASDYDLSLMPSDAVTSIDGLSLAKDEQVELIFTFKIAENFTGEEIKLYARVKADGKSYSVNSAALTVSYVTLSAPVIDDEGSTAYTVRAGSPFYVYGEASLGSRVQLFREGSSTPLTLLNKTTDQPLGNDTIQMPSDSRWFTAKVAGVSAETKIYAKVNGKYESAHVPVHISQSVDFDGSAIWAPQKSGGYQRYVKNGNVGFPTLLAALSTKLIGPDFIPELTLYLPEGVTVDSVYFRFGSQPYIQGSERTTDLRGDEIANTEFLHTYIADAPFTNWTETGVKRVEADVSIDGVTYTFTVAQMTILIDPSGIVTDRDTHKPIEGVEVTLYKDIGGNKWEKWNAEDYLQLNPLYTDANGCYGWDVPEGTYKLVLSKEGYSPVEIEQYTPRGGSQPEDIVIPPVRTDVDVVMQKTAMAAAGDAVLEVLDSYVWDNSTDIDAVVAAVEAALAEMNVTIDIDIQRTPATKEAAGSVTITYTITPGEGESGSPVTQTIDKSIEKLPSTPSKPPYNPPSTPSYPTGGGSTGSDDKVKDKNETKDEDKKDETPAEEPASEPEPLVFLDVPDSYWAAADIAYMSARGLLIGMGDDLFLPYGSMTRGMMVTLLGRIAEADVTGLDGSEFADVLGWKYYAPYVSWAYNAGVVSGRDNGAFDPDCPITRQELCVMIANYLGYENLPADGGLEDFSDADLIAPWATEAVAALHAAGIINGMDDGSFSPRTSATRAQVAAIMHRILELPKE